jgi:AraC-like DNA-binding protein
VYHPIAWYREFLPCAALQAEVYAFFSFVGGPRLASPQRPVLREIPFWEATFCSPQFADGHISMVFELGRTCDAHGDWYDDAIALGGTVIGPMTGVGRTEGNSRPEMIGVYFRPGGVNGFIPVGPSELIDRGVAIEALWGSPATLVTCELRELDEATRIDRLESMLLARLATRHRHGGSIDVRGLATTIRRRRGRWTVQDMARAAGVSRQHLTREFREQIGISPKLYSRLSRFHAALAYAGSPSVDWAHAAAEAGFADQSHMIAEFRQFSGLTPHALAQGQWFHPFIERAKQLR